MNKLELKFCGNPVLREKSSPIEKITPEVLQILDEMVNIMDYEDGIGLAAPQVGILQRFVIIKCKLENDKEPQIYKIINPKILDKSEEQVVIEEGCLSVQDESGPVYAEVSRPKSVVIEWLDEQGVIHNKNISGIPARIFQHEIDHLDGKLFIDYLSSVKREMVMNKVKKRKDKVSV